MAELSSVARQKLADEGYDLGFMASTQPQGNVKIYSDHIKSGTGCYTFLTVYHYPKENMPAFWLSRIVNEDNVIALLSIGTQNSAKVRPQIDRAIEEYESQMDSNKMKPTEQLGAAMNTRDLVQLYQDMRSNSETLKRIKLRLLVYDNTHEQLMDHVHRLQRKYWDFKMVPFIDEQEYALHSIYMPLSEQEHMTNKRKGKVIQSYDLGGSYMFNYVSLEDPGGTYFGYTQTNGAFIFNPYNLRDNNRTRVFSLVSGRPGMGKSVLSQMLINDAFMRGDRIRNFDVVGEYKRSTELRDGVIIDTSQKGNRVNMFQIFPTVTNDDGTISERGSFNQNVNKIIAIAHILNPKLNDDDLGVLQDILIKFYIHKNMWTLNPSAHPEDVRVFLDDYTQYPTVLEFTGYVRDYYYTYKDTTDSQTLHSIRLIYRAFKAMVTQYGDMFNGHTNIKDFSKEPVVDFDMSEAKQSSSGVDNQLFQAQFFSYLSLIASEVVKSGEHYRRLIRDTNFKDDKLGLNIPYYYINIDEAENYFNPKYPEVVEMIADMMEEMRKNYCAITFASPSLRDILRNDGLQTASPNLESYEDSVKRIFSAIQYFHLFNLQGSDVRALKKFFQDSGKVSTDQLATLSSLEPYQLLTIIVGEHSYRWQTEPTDAQLKLYR